MGEVRKWTVAETAAVLAAWPLVIFLDGYVVSRLWCWFVAPLGATDIGTVQAMGLCTFVSAVRFNPSKPTRDMEPATLLLSMVFASLAYLATGYALSQLGGV